MDKLKDVIKSSEYQELIIKNFNDFGFELINNELQVKKFKKEFEEYELDINDKEDNIIYNILINTYWFCKAEDYEYFGLYFNTVINEYSCIIKIDSEWEFRYMGNDCQKWINKYFRRKNYFNINKKVDLFKKETNFINKKIMTFKEIDSDDLLLIYRNNLN